MARTPLAQAIGALTRRVQDQAAAEQPGVGPSRRDVLRGAVALGVAAGGVGLSRARSAQAAGIASSVRVVVVGAGLAGLSAAYQLRQVGIISTILEASDRVGGHTAVRQLAQTLGLPLDNLLAAEPSGTEPFYWFDGAPYTYAQATDDIKTIWQQIHSDVSAASYPTLYNSYTARGYALDHLSIADWIAAYVPGGAASRLGRLLDVAYNIEYGAETSQQSSLNMLYLLGYSGQGQFRVFGPSNEKYHVAGGNDQLATGLAAALPGQVRLGTQLVALARNSDGTWTVTSRAGTKTTSQVADHVVLALPFSLLARVDLTRAGFPALKTTAIRELPMGTNSKLQLQFSDRHWNLLGNTGDTYSDRGYQTTWDVTRGQAGSNGVLVDYTGGAIGADFGSLTPAQYAQRFLGQIEPVLPGLTAKWNGRVLLDFWRTYPWSLGSYSYWKVGQYTGFSGVEKEAVGSCHFAGEHTSQDSQGYLNGAVETGYRAAAEILAALK